MFFRIFSEWTWQNVLIRIVTSVIVGTFIGIDRGVKRRGGGARTTLTVCIGATMVMLLEQYMEQLYPDSFDISRMSAQVISGVGFLGAGSILISGHQIKGLTSAASIWTSAAIGLAIGLGFIDGAITVMICWLLAIHIVPYLENFFYRKSRFLTIYIEAEDGKTITSVSKKLKEDNCRIDTFEVDKPKAKGHYFQILTTFQVPKNINKETYLKDLQEIKGVFSANEV